MADSRAGEGQGPSGVVSPPDTELHAGYNGNVPTIRLSLLVSATDAHCVNVLDGFVQQSHTRIGRATNISLHAHEGPAAPELIRRIGALGIPFEGHAQIGHEDYLIAGDGQQTALVWLRLDS